jgi:hypothetical protein
MLLRMTITRPLTHTASHHTRHPMQSTWPRTVVVTMPIMMLRMTPNRMMHMPPARTRVTSATFH